MIIIGNIYAGLSGGGGGGAVNTLDNGLTLTGTNGQLGGTLIQDTAITNGAFDLSFDRLLLGGVTGPPATGFVMPFIGDSITVGTGGGGINFPNLVSAALGATASNLGIVGCFLEKRAPVQTPNLIDNIPLIPVKVAGQQYICIGIGINDFDFGAANYNPANYLADYTTFLTAVNAAGWVGKEIILLSLNYIDPAIYGTAGPQGGTLTFVDHQAFTSQVQAVAATFNANYVDVYTPFTQQGGNFLLSGNAGIHPNGFGYQVMANAILQVIQPDVFNTGQSLAVNGEAAFNDIRYPTDGVIPDVDVLVLGVDFGTNKVGVASALSNNIRTQANIWVGGNIQQINSVAPDVGLQPYDLLLRESANIYSVFEPNNGIYAFLQLCDSGGHTVINNVYGSGLISLIVHGHTGVTVSHSGFILIGTGASDNTFGVEGDVWLLYPGAGRGTGVGAQAAGGFGMFRPFDGGVTKIVNAWRQGKIQFVVSEGVDLQEIEIANIDNFGNWILEDNNGFTAIPSSRFTVNSTSQGLLVPRMTTTQMNAIAAPATGLLIYNTSFLGFYQFNGTAWVPIGGGSSSVPLILSFAQSTLTANTTLANITTSASIDFMRISAALFATLVGATASIRITWTDQTFTVQTLILPGALVASGTANISPFTVQCAPSTPLKVDLLITGGTGNCTVGGSIERVAQI